MAFARRTARRVNEFNRLRWRTSKPGNVWTAARFRGHKILIERHRPLNDPTKDYSFSIKIDGSWYGGRNNLNAAKYRAFLKVLEMSEFWIQLSSCRK